MSETVTLRIGGMTCAACVSRVERALARVEGVEAAAVSLAAERADVVVAEGGPAAVERLRTAVEEAGYDAQAEVAGAPAGDIEGIPRGEVLRVGTALALALPLLAEMPGHFGIPWFRLPPLLALALAAPVQLFLALPLYRAAWKALKARSGNMDLLVAIGTSVAFLSGAVAVLRDPFGHPHHYLEASAVVVALVMLRRSRGSSATARRPTSPRPRCAAATSRSSGRASAFPPTASCGRGRARPTRRSSPARAAPCPSAPATW
jgi:Cu+-exporting ATPase